MPKTKELDSRNLIYVAQEKAFAPGCSNGWEKIIKPKGVENGRLFGFNASDELMNKIYEEQLASQRC